MDLANPFRKRRDPSIPIAFIGCAIFTFCLGVAFGLQVRADGAVSDISVASKSLQIDQLEFDQFDTLVEQLKRYDIDKPTADTVLSMWGLILTQMHHSAAFVPQDEIPDDTKELLRIPVPKLREEDPPPPAENNVIPPPQPTTVPGRLRVRVFVYRPLSAFVRPRRHF